VAAMQGRPPDGRGDEATREGGQRPNR
jgi:hypothetical protein